MCPVIAWDLVSHGIPVLPQAPLQPSHDSSSRPRLRASPSASPRECFWDLGRVANGSATLPKSERCHIIPFRGSPSTFSGWWQKHTKTLASMLSSQRRQCSGLVLGCGWTEPTSDGLRKIGKMCIMVPSRETSWFWGATSPQPGNTSPLHGHIEAAGVMLCFQPAMWICDPEHPPWILSDVPPNLLNSRKAYGGIAYI